MRIICCNLLFVFILCQTIGIRAQSLPDTIQLINKHSQKIDLLHQGYVISNEKDLTPESAWQLLTQQQKQPVSSSIGFTKNIFWVGFTLQNLTASPIEEVIEIDNPQLDYVTVYQVLSTGIQHQYTTGDKFLFNKRPVNNRNFLFPIDLAAGETITLIIKIDKRNTTVNLPIYLWNDQEHAKADYQRNLGYGLYFGFVGLCLVYALMAFLFLRKPVYAWYFLWVFGSAFYVFTALGFSFQYLYPFTTDFNSPFRVYLEVANVITFIKFSEHFLNLSVFTPRIRKILQYFLLTFFTLIALSAIAYDFFESNSVWVLPVLNALMLGSGLLVILSAILSFPKQKLIVTYYFIAFGMLMIGFGMVTIGEFGWIAVEKFPVNPVMVGSGIEIFIFSMALSYQIRKLYDERNQLSLKLAEQQKAMLKSYIEGVERERVRIGRELHDDIGSRLSSIKRFMLKHNEEDDFAQLQLDQLCEDVRTMSHQLAPQALHLAGLKKMIYELGYHTERTTSLKVDVQFYDFPDELPEEISSQLYRIVQEAINNVLKHAEAQNIDIQFFGYPEELVITLDDDGKGISENSKDGIGIQNMKARTQSLNGSFEISSKANKGTSLLFRIPLQSL